MALRIRNWERFQHFRNRVGSPWIKLYRSLLDDPEWHQLDPKSAKVLVMLWMSAFGPKGELPPLKKLSFRLRMTEKELNQQCTILSSWLLQVDDKLISNGCQDVPLEIDIEVDIEEKELSPKRGRKIQPSLRTLPENWSPNEQTVERLAGEFRFTNGDAERYLRAFTDQCKAKGYTYKDFDAAFCNCVRQDWPKFRNGAKTMPKRSGDPHEARLS